MTVHRFTIPDWRPVTLNIMMGGTLRNRIKRKKQDREFIGVYARIADVPPATGRRRVSLEINLSGRQKEADPDALFKSLNDGLVHARLLIDDSKKYVELGDVVYSRNKTEPAGTTIVLEDLLDLAT